MKQLRNLHLVGATGAIRTATYNDKEHLVVPIVAMVETVVWAINSDVPEFVPAEELAQTPHQWNGRFCFAGHPEDGGTQVTANTPRTSEKSFGIIFDTIDSKKILETRSLQFNAWLDPAKAALVGAEALDVITRLRAGERVEVSIGCYVEAQDVDGEFKGKKYHGKWTNIVSDHLAFIAAGQKGACSIEAGCGAPRSAVRHAIEHASDGIHMERVMPETEMPKRSYQWMLDNFKTMMSQVLRQTERGMSDSDLRYSVDEALRAVEPGYQYIDAIYPDGTTTFKGAHVIYCVQPGDEFQTKRRSYTMVDNKAVLTEDAVEVEMVTEYKPRAAEAAKTTCSCGGQHARTAEETPAEKEYIMREDIKKLVDAGAITADEAKGLEAIPAEKLASLMAKPAETVTPAPVAAAAKETPAPIAQTEDEFLKTAPQSIRDLIESSRKAEAMRLAAEKIEKDALVASLKTAQTVYSEDDLNAMSNDSLKKLSALVNVEKPADFSLLGLPRAAAASKTDYTPPDSFARDLAKAKAH